jgi:hypothetical protein
MTEGNPANDIATSRVRRLRIWADEITRIERRREETPDPEILLCCSYLGGLKRQPGIPSAFPVLFLGPTLRF